MALGTIQKISMAELLMTQHKSRSELFSAAQWLEAIRKRNGLSGTTIFEMAAEPSRRPMATSLGGSFCRWMLVLMFVSMTQHRNSMSTMRATDLNLDRYPMKGVTGFAGLAVYNLCMVPGVTGDSYDHCSVVDHLWMMKEPNVKLHRPRPSLRQSLADGCNDHVLPQSDFRTDGMMRTSGVFWERSLSRFSICICSCDDNFHFHSGNLDKAGMQECLNEFSPIRASPFHFQSYAGNLHLCNFQSSSGIVNSVNSLSLWGASTIFTFQDVQCVHTVFSWQC